MKPLKHTKGPWYVEEITNDKRFPSVVMGDHPGAYTEKPQIIINESHNQEMATMRINALLISESPAMYRAIFKFINCDHQEHLAVRLNDEETQAVKEMKEILSRLHK